MCAIKNTSINKKEGLSKNFFLISFLPAIAYWYLESYYGPKVAVVGGLLLAVVELLIEKLFIKHVHTISKFNFLLIAFLGGLSFFDNKGIWFKLQPCMTGLGIGIFLLYRLWMGKGLLLEMMESLMDNKAKPPEEILKQFEIHTAIFFILYGSFMGFVATYSTTGYWTFFKTIGFYVISFIFMIIEVVWMRISIKRLIKKRQKEIVSKF